MSDLGPLFLVLAAQITLPIVGGLLLSRRRDPATASLPLSVAVVAVLLLTPLAFLPQLELPAKAISESVSHESENADPMPATTSPPGGIDLLQLFRLPKPETVAEKPATFNVWRIVALAGLGLAGFGMIRFSFALLATLRVIRGSSPLDDCEMQSIAMELAKALGCRRSIALRESRRVSSAATAGWLRPIVLVSPAWRMWSIEERRAVLAHEIAHVARGDFFTRLLTRLAVALHGYHPLLRWLASRLELQQEMAADLLAAPSCGGRSLYLKSLAALALKADAQPVGLVPTFLSRPRTLLRRIAMLRVKEDNARRSRRWPTLLAVALMTIAGLGLRGTTPESLAGPILPAKFTEKAAREPLDASFIIPSKHEDEVGVFAVRIGEMCQTPGMEKMAEMYSGVLTTIFGEGKKLFFKFADIEQIAGRVTLTHRPEMPKPNSNLSMSLTSIRMNKDFDWTKQLQGWGTDWKEHSHDGTKYLSCKMSIEALGFKDTTVWVYMPDKRTMVLESEENIKILIDGKKKPRVMEWAKDWSAVEGGMLAIALTDVKGKMPKKFAVKKEQTEQEAAVMKAVQGLCTKVSRAAIGIDLGEGCTVKLRFACSSADDAREVDDGCQSLTKLAQKMLDPDSKDGAEKLGMMLIRGVEFDKTVDHVVEVRMTSKTGVADLLKSFGDSK